MTWYRFLIICDIFFSLSGLTIRNECSLVNPCMNLAVCSSQNGIKCLCNRGFRGNLCEIWPRECLADFCLNEGTCVMSRQIPRCLCKPEYSGAFCEISLFSTENIQTTTNLLDTTLISDDQTNPIEVNTTTIFLTTKLEELTSTETIYSEKNSTPVFVKSGSNSLPNSICDFHPCLNNAQCISLNDTEYKFYCVCPENYDGLLCEKVITKPTRLMEKKKSEINEPVILTEQVNSDNQELTSTIPNVFIITENNEINANQNKSFCAHIKPCNNNAQCVDLEPTVQNPKSFMCLCDKDYTGTFCHIKKNNKICLINPCFNSGVCVPSSDEMSYTCDCQNGFSGDYCELKLA